MSTECDTAPTGEKYFLQRLIVFRQKFLVNISQIVPVDLKAIHTIMIKLQMNFSVLNIMELCEFF